MFHKKAKTTKKVVLRLECTQCKYKAQLALKRCKHFELGYAGMLFDELRPILILYAVETRRRRVPRWCSKLLHIRVVYGQWTIVTSGISMRWNASEASDRKTHPLLDSSVELAMK